MCQILSSISRNHIVRIVIVVFFNMMLKALIALLVCNRVTSSHIQNYKFLSHILNTTYEKSTVTSIWFHVTIVSWHICVVLLRNSCTCLWLLIWSCWRVRIQSSTIVTSILVHVTICLWQICAVLLRNSWTCLWLLIWSICIYNSI